MDDKLIRKSAGIYFALLIFLLPCASTPSVAQGTPNLYGSWSGTFTSNHSDVQPFFLSIIITSDSSGRVIGNSTLEAKCMKNANLNVTLNGSNIVLVGNDGHGDNLTIRGTLDPSGTIIDSTYIMNGSQGGGCETDDGKGSLQKQ